MERLNVNPTRMNLTTLKKRLVTAKRGHKLMKDKRDSLMKGFLELARENKRFRDEVEAQLAEVYANFSVASAAMSQEVMEEARKNWARYLDGATTDEEKDIRLNTMQAIISKIFGSNSFKLSQAIPQQKGLVELFNAEMEDLKN